MSNQFNLVVERPQSNLAAGMKWLLGTYTIRFNRRHKEFAHVLSGCYKSLIRPSTFALPPFPAQVQGTRKR